MIILLMTIIVEQIKNLTRNLFQGNPIVEACVACKFIWENVEEALDLSKEKTRFNTKKERNPILAAQVFQYFCKISPDIFYEPCNKMFDKLYFFTEDFAKETPILDLCIKNKMCPYYNKIK